MSSRSATARSRPAPQRRSGPRPGAAAARRRATTRRAAARRRRRRLLAVLGAAVGGVLLVTLVVPIFHHAVREITLPLRHEDIIRQQAAEKGLDPSLIAAVIYAESHFRDGQTSAAGAQGLMQLTPGTARDIARKSGGIAFHVADLGTPQVNIAYGSYYLRYLLDRYGGNPALALAAYNGGEGNVDHWIAAARASDRNLKVDDIPFPETRAYVQRVLGARRDYRKNYARELGM